MTIDMTFPLNSIWKLERKIDKSPFEPVFKVKIMKSNEPHFIGKFTDKNGDVTFYGESRRNQREIINIKQYQENPIYYAFYHGMEVPTGLIRYIGRWVDVNGKDGTFELVMLSLN